MPMPMLLLVTDADADQYTDGVVLFLDCDSDAATFDGENGEEEEYESWRDQRGERLEG